RVAHEGTAAFYQGRVAEAIVATDRERGGVLTPSDLAAYVPALAPPVEGTFLGRRVLGFPPPGSRALVLEVLGILRGEDFARVEPSGAAWLHLLAGAMAQGFADRARWFGDVPVPVASLLVAPRLAALRARIPPDRVGSPVTDLKPDAGTAHVSVVDTAGN